MFAAVAEYFFSGKSPINVLQNKTFNNLCNLVYLYIANEFSRSHYHNFAVKVQKIVYKNAIIFQNNFLAN